MVAPATNTKDHGGFRPPWFTLISTGVMACLYGLFGAAPEILMFDRQGLLDGEVWRWLTGHLVHSDLSHLTWNLGAYLLLGGFLETSCKARAAEQLTWFAMSGFVVSAAVYVFCPDIHRYVGLSGVLNGFFVIALLHIWKRYRNPLTVLVAVGTIAKVGLELATHQSVVGAGTWAVVPEAHAAGLLAGIAFVLMSKGDLIGGLRLGSNVHRYRHG